MVGTSDRRQVCGPADVRCRARVAVFPPQHWSGSACAAFVTGDKGESLASADTRGMCAVSGARWLNALKGRA